MKNMNLNLGSGLDFYILSGPDIYPYYTRLFVIQHFNYMEKHYPKYCFKRGWWRWHVSC